MPQVWNKEKRLSVHITPRRRAEQFPADLTMKNGQLYCKFCQKPIVTLRMDNLRLHLTSIVHKDNKQKMGAPLNSDNGKYIFVITWIAIYMVKSCISESNFGPSRF